MGLRSSKLGYLLLFFSTLAAANDGDEKNSEFLLKKDTKIYWYRSGGVLGSIMAPAGFTLREVSKYFTEFRDGKRFGEGAGHDFPELVATLEKDGVKRIVRLGFDWGILTKKWKQHVGTEASRKEWIKLTKKNKRNFKEGEFEYGGAAYFAYRKYTEESESNIDQYQKVIGFFTMNCLGGVTYTERDPETGFAIDPEDWKFEHIGDEIARSFRCEIDKSTSKKKPKVR